MVVMDWDQEKVRLSRSHRCSFDVVMDCSTTASGTYSHSTSSSIMVQLPAINKGKAYS